MGGVDLLWVAVATIACCCAAEPCIHSLEETAPTASGYLPINQTSGSLMFFTYYEAIQNSVSRVGHRDLNETTRPILLWLQGGPGCSSMIGNFYELGPWRVGEDLCLHRNPAPWNRISGLLFLDNPVGSGFSIAPLVEDIPTDQDGIAQDVYTALQGFYHLFPAFRKRPFYVTGESYAGKHIPSVASYILHKQKEQGTSSHWLRLDGIAIGNGLTHPIVQVQVHGPTAYHMGLIVENQWEEVDTMAANVVALIEEEKWVEAYHARVELLEYLEKVTGLTTLYDIRRTVDYYFTKNGTNYLSAFMNKEEVQTCLLKAEPQLWEDCSNTVIERMAADVPKSTMHLVEFLLNQSVPVLLYQGQFDLRDGVASSEAWIRLLNWDGSKAFYAAEKKVWKESGITVGYVRTVGSLTHAVISDAGHLVPADQAYSSQRMIEGWITGSICRDMYLDQSQDFVLGGIAI